MDTEFVWEGVSRSRRPLGLERYVSIRGCSLKISAGFDRKDRLHDRGMKYVIIRRDMKHQCLLLHFINDHDLERIRLQDPFVDGIFVYGGDGGGKRRNRPGGVIACRAVIHKTSWLKVLADLPLEERPRFAPEPGPAPDQYIIRIIPGFMFRSNARVCDAPAGIKGIYCYEDGNGKVVYIGQGLIKSRFQRHAKEKAISATFFRWSAVNDEALRLHAEAHYLDQFVRRYGQLPKYNLTPPAESSRRRQGLRKD